jgi:hypothetical protein
MFRFGARWNKLFKLVSEFEGETGFFPWKDPFECMVPGIFLKESYTGIVITVGIQPDDYSISIILCHLSIFA